MNPVVQQHNTNFLIYIKDKFKLLVPKDITVFLQQLNCHKCFCFYAELIGWLGLMAYQPL